MALALSRGWVRCYTAGVSRQSREERRAEIESDVYEHQADAALAGRTGFAVELLFRIVLGMPADLSWRLAQVRLFGWFVPVRRRAGIAGSWTVRRGLPGVSWLLASAYVLIGAVLLLSLAFPHDKPVSELVGGGVFLIVAGGLILGGLRVVERRAWRGMLMIAAGVGPLGLVFFASVVAPLASVLALVYGYVKARSGKKRRVA